MAIPPAGCAKLIGDQYRQPVEAAPIPTPAPVTYGEPLTAALEAAIVAPWAAAYVTTSGALEKANGRTADAIKIVEGCEARVNAARPNAGR